MGRPFFAVRKKKSINFFRNLINYKMRLSIRKQWNISLSDRKCWCVCAQKGKMKYENLRSRNGSSAGRFKTIVGAEYVLTEPENLEQYQTDEETDPRKFHLPEAVVLPKDAQEIAAVIKLANTYDVPVTVRSGGTSLAGGAIPVCGGIVLLMERLNKIIELNAEGMYMEVEAGVRTVDIQKYANEAGFLYAGDPCSAESCLIGGNIATNAGGNKAVRYGVTRDQVYAVEVVTPTGEIVELGARLKKKSTGYCLEQLIMGSEARWLITRRRLSCSRSRLTDLICWLCSAIRSRPWT